jgi:hypothetical protein
VDLDQRKGRVHDCSLHSSTHTYDVAVDYYPHARSVSPCSFFFASDDGSSGAHHPFFRRGAGGSTPHDTRPCRGDDGVGASWQRALLKAVDANAIRYAGPPLG